MGSLKLLKKIRNKLDEYIENREVRLRRASFTQTPPHSWGPDSFKSERNRRKFYDERTRRHTDVDLNECRIKMAANETCPRKMSNNGLPDRVRVSEGNLPCPRKSHNAVARSGYEDREKSPRKSDGELIRRRRDDQRALRESGRPRASNDRLNRPLEDVSSVPPIPPQLVAEYHPSMPLSPRDQKKNRPQLKLLNKNSLLGARYRLQDGARQEKPQKYHTVDWDALIKAKNEQVKSAAEAKKRDEEEKRRAAEQKWKAAEQRRRAAEQAETESRKYEAEHQSAREIIIERKFADEAEKKARVARVQRENEERRIHAFGSPAGSTKQTRPPTWPSGPAICGSKPQHRPLEKREIRPDHPAAATNTQERIIQRSRPLKRRSSVPIRPQREIIRKAPPKLAPLTQENLCAKEAIEDCDLEDCDDDLDPLGRGLGDNMRTFSSRLCASNNISLGYDTVNRGARCNKI